MTRIPLSSHNTKRPFPLVNLFSAGVFFTEGRNDPNVTKGRLLFPHHLVFYSPRFNEEFQFGIEITNVEHKNLREAGLPPLTSPEISSSVHFQLNIQLENAFSLSAAEPNLRDEKPHSDIRASAPPRLFLFSAAEWLRETSSWGRHLGG